MKNTGTFINDEMEMGKSDGKRRAGFRRGRQGSTSNVNQMLYCTQ